MPKCAVCKASFESIWTVQKTCSEACKQARMREQAKANYIKYHPDRDVGFAVCLGCGDRFEKVGSGRSFWCEKPACQEKRKKRHTAQVIASNEKRRIRERDALRIEKSRPKPYVKCRFKGCKKNAYPNRYYCSSHHSLVTKMCADGFGDVTDNSLDEMNGLTKAIIDWRKKHPVPQEESRRHFCQTEKFAS